jgi:serine/threonine protein kinase
MNYCDGGDLTTLIKNQQGKHFAEEQILDWFIQLCLALRYIHQRRVTRQIRTRACPPVCHRASAGG